MKPDRARSTLFVGNGVRAEPLATNETMAAGDLVLGATELETVAPSARYVALSELGRGGMGRVLTVFDRVLGRHVAQKEVLEKRGAALLVAEAQICAQLEHPAIVPVYDLSTGTDGLPRYTMRIVRGRCLADILDEHEPPPLAQLLGMVRQVCLAVDYAHSRGVVHRDLKPQNIIVGSFGEVYVLDWGIAHVMEGSDLNCAADFPQLPIAGTPEYMSPEQLEGRIGPTVDVYALGAILFEILVGARPFPEATDIGSIRSRRTAPPPSRAAGQKKVPRAFDGLVSRCLARDPEARPSSARAISETIDAYLDGERERAEREREAATLSAQGRAAWAERENLDIEAELLEAQAQAQLATLAPHDPVEKKEPMWAIADQAKKKKAEAAQGLARAEIAFSTALGRVHDHPEARAGLAQLHVAQLLEAERAGERERMTRHLELARSYDDGHFANELADEGELSVDADLPRAKVEVFRYEARGPLLVLGEGRALGDTPTRRRYLASGSYLVVCRAQEREVRYPLRIERAKTHRLSLRFPRDGELPAGLILIPGGPFLSITTNAQREERRLPDFAIARFPVTMGAYAAWLDELGKGTAAQRRVPRAAEGPHLHRVDGAWRVAPGVVEAHGRAYAPEDRELDLPVHGITWYEALAYAQWLSARSGDDYRLPTSLEWEKAMRGADARPYPMCTHMDSSFAKIRTSRAEGTQIEPIGAFPLDVSPHGVRDLTGGVADWTSTMADGLAPPGLDNEESADAEARLAFWRGGHWGNMAAVDVSKAVPLGLKHRSNGVGFRLALSLDAHGSSDFVVEPMR